MGKLLKFLQENYKALFVVGVIFVLVGVAGSYRKRVLSFDSVPLPNQSIDGKKDLPVRVVIPTVKIDKTIEEGKIADGVWEISESNATHLSTSAAPGERGNTVIYGHNKRAIFGNLAGVKVGQSIEVETAKGKVYRYVVDGIEVVNPSNIGWVSPTDFPALTIYTCTGFLDSKRLVVRAYPT